ncbi:hypothetical protein TWF569_009346 [Orbilia oligospora]|uniref:Spo12 n=2 Tax=Orbilia oligospora TaxID=2813651 RepID=G1XCX0_ARTOA|nr:hypothetical protein AOL_s00079g290 [Orbilia oligospora ATCC 24927]KAF3085449.1 hypothetical protein TWF102_011593 [Orbilia oligospora]EGX49069.1 hypothetical protein AOL_s00079g290 [Orbilia oligospora ATCC 24927]KAF3094630.1 hypothetical protein TWF706_008467 [Orbilia oligospora]KAF3096469.1 hypothetical protein TWF103_009803 [Orbilia oligospora]KAF3133186.1 hypothetical protein TWF703_007028 [Orbilia oligospora]
MSTPLSEIPADTNMSSSMDIDEPSTFIPSTSEASPLAVVEPLHQLAGTPADNLEAQRKLLQQKLADHAANAEKFSSPTDNMMSPCSQKLAAQKKKQFGKTKPTLLKSAFAQVAGQENRIPKKRTDDDSPF